MGMNFKGDLQKIWRQGYPSNRNHWNAQIVNLPLRHAPQEEVKKESGLRG